MQNTRIIRQTPHMSVIDCQQRETHCAPAARAPEERLRQQKALLMDDLTIGQFLEFIPSPAMVLNDTRQIVLVNKRCFDLYRTDAGILGQRPGEALKCVNANTMKAGCGTSRACRHCGITRSVVKGLAGQSSEDECRLTLARSAAIDARDFRANVNPFRKGDHEFVILVLTDINDEKRRRSMERIFFHDTLNSAIALRGYAELAGTDDLDDFTKQTFLHRTTDLADHIIDELDNQRMLLLAETGELSVRPAALDSVAILQHMVDAYASMASMASVELKVSTASEGTEFWSDKVILLRAISNLVKNAIEASAPGEQVTLGCDVEPKQLVFWTESSAYIPLSIQLQIFSRNFSTKAADRGLGTYSTKYLVENYLGGGVSFSSSPSAGTRFCIHLTGA